jgi:nucleotide-binding universal stress UspA family protein
MKHGSHRHVVCALRGRPESRETVTRAIDLALEHDARLTFFLVIDAEFLGQAAPTLSPRPLRLVYRQLEEIGEFAMLISCDRARRRGVKRVEYLIRKGNVPEQLRQLATEIDAEVMVMGRPMRSLGKSIFSPQGFDRFVAELEAEANIQIVQVPHERDDGPEPTGSTGG